MAARKNALKVSIFEKKVPSKAPPFVQIAIAAAYNDDVNDVVVALDRRGRVWVRGLHDDIHGWCLLDNKTLRKT